MNILACQILVCYTWKNIESSYENNVKTISALTSSEKFPLLDGLYSVSDIQDYIGNVKHRITFKTKSRNHLELLTN